MAKKGSDIDDNMPDNPVDAAPGSLREGIVKNTRFSHQAKILYIAFWHSHTRNTLIATFLGILVLIILIGRGQLQINEWTKDFWNAISRKDLHEFVFQLGVFFVIASVLLIFNIVQTFLNQYLKMKLREGLTDDLISQWMQPKRAFRLTMAGEVGVNPDQKLHEDARHLAESTADLGINLLQASVTLIIFIPTLWATTAGFVFSFSGYSFPLPGYMIWAVLLYVGAASFLTWFVARNLVTINANRYAREADLRAALMHTNRSIDSITLMGAEKDEKRYLDGRVQNVLNAIWHIVVATTKLTGITAGYGWVSNVAPYIIASPIYFGGGIDLGGLQAAVQAFNQAHQSLRWFVDNYGALADWRATMLRVATFRQAVVQMDGVDRLKGEHITVKTNDSDIMTFDNLLIRTANGKLTLTPENLAIKRGQNTLIYAPQDVDKTILYHALAGLWPWGQGTVGLPNSGLPNYIPDAPYIPPGTLRTVLLYPATDKNPTDEEIERALEITGLSDYFSALDEENVDWERRLNDVERRSIAFARVLLTEPEWIVANQVMDGIDETVRKRIASVVFQHLKNTTFVYISRRNDESYLFDVIVEVKFEPSEQALSKSEKETPKSEPADSMTQAQTIDAETTGSEAPKAPETSPANDTHEEPKK
ncbi:ABC transporter ATP-binding protein/permease [uncultured Bartonella sp.]|uniref:ABC transporter ATP-binding protein/permease n=1 Tax=uncultured Bartonella sp. TaxID=104108 RepID=UPI0025DFC582|nr:ABC transporter ATP-binding protein/permease [uncultured Bartonella sp.]